MEILCEIIVSEKSAKKSDKFREIQDEKWKFYRKSSLAKKTQ